MDAVAYLLQLSDTSSNTALAAGAARTQSFKWATGTCDDTMLTWRCDANMAGKGGLTVLHIAIQQRSVDLVAHMTRTVPELDVRLRDAHDATPFDVAMAHQRAGQDCEQVKIVTHCCTLLFFRPWQSNELARSVSW